MKKRGGIVLIILGLVLVTLSGLTVLEVTREAAEAAAVKNAAAEAAIKKVYVVMAQKDLPENVAISAQDVATKEFPEDYVPAGAIAAPEYAVGKYTTSRVFKGQILVAPLLSPTRRSSQMAAKVPNGKVAMAVVVNDAMTSLGALRAGDKVDILLTVDLSKGLSARGGAAPSSSGGSAPVDQPASLLSTQLTLQNAEILAIGLPESDTTGTQAKTQQNPQQNSRTITFLLDHQDALMLKYVKDSGGTMDLIVRSPEDKRLVSTEGVTFDSLYNQFHFRFPQPINR